MKKIIYGKNKGLILDAIQKDKEKYGIESIHELVDETSVSDLSNYFTSYSMFGGNELVIWRVSDKKYITQEHLQVIKGFEGKDFLLALYMNLPKNSKILKVFTSLEKFEEEEKIKIFPFLSALTKKDKDQSLNLYYRMLNEGNDPIYINSMIFYQFKNLLHGVSGSGTYASLNPFVKGNLSRDVGMYRLEECASIMREIYLTDNRLKTTALDNEVLVLNLILKIVNTKVPA